ncbi:pilus assembly protein CpaF [Paenibacillus glacialis]|uniref:Pilus assembly protein CpaF n=1 Tax=Paenibacillus glacialis TaxID=494026 RepID=A0A168MF83_9BACL|nr:pilus assembly protein CpaF [Paenibacillus glacialis]
MTSQWINISLIVVLVFVIGVIVFFKLTEKREPRRNPHDLDKKFTIPTMIEFVKKALNDMTTSDLDHLGLSEEEFNRQIRQRLQLKKALKGSIYGDRNDKNYVKNTIFDLLYKNYGLNDDNINQVIQFSNSKQLTSQDKFEIILHKYKKKYGMDALSTMIDNHNLAELKEIIDDHESESYIITVAEMDDVFKKEQKSLSFEDKLNIVVQRIYQEFKGFSVIDDIRDMRIDGVSGGVSGIPINQIDPDDDMMICSNQAKMNTIPLSHDSVWIYYKGKTIHLSFLSFQTEGEFKRVCQNIYRYNNPGQLSDQNGFIVNDMKDGSRVVVVRPKFSESWAFFVRKFDTGSAHLEELISVKDTNRLLVITLLIYMIKGCRIVSLTGAQGTGKTTLLMALVRYIHASYTIRVQEMTFELRLRKIYHNRNILSFRETDTINGQAGLDLQKKTDGVVNLLGEIATDVVAAWMIQMAQVASLFTLFTHHAKTTNNLIESIRNSLLKTGVFTNEKIAEQQVVSVLNFDVHMKKDLDGKRYIERITEIVPLDQDTDYPTDFRNVSDPQDKIDSFMNTTAEYFRRQTDRKLYEARNIIEYRDGGYVAVNRISSRNQEEMLEFMSPRDKEEYIEFTERNWGMI